MVDSGEAAGTSSEEAQRIKGLEQEVRELRRANAIVRSPRRLSSRRGSTPTEVIADDIDRHRAEFAVEPIYKVLQVTPSTYYAAKSRPPSARAIRDAAMMQVLTVLWVANIKVHGAHSCGRPLAAPATTSAGTKSLG